jgi:methionyl-tRNA formyltransferase
MKDRPRIVFFGTPEFAVRSLEIIVDNDYPVLAVVTAPDKPAGRGLKLKVSPVKEFTVQKKIPVLQPTDLHDPGFHEQLQSISPDLIIVVAFRILPKEIWGMPPLGTINLHASLLPQYRGAAPINWAIINGETETGVATFFLEEKIDTGNIVFTEKTSISFDETAGELHDRLKVIGANLVVKTIESLQTGKLPGISQGRMINQSIQLKKAPKIHKEDCLIDWNKNSITIYNLIRGLSPHPGAYSVLKDKNNNPVYIKIYRAEPEVTETHLNPGELFSNGRDQLKIATLDGFLCLKEVQMTGHKSMAIADFLNGFGRLFI